MAKIIIVGGGVSGLSAGIYAQLNGHTVTVCEKHTKAGGNLTGWQREGYKIDNCIHWLTGTNPATETYKMWCELGALGDGVKVYYGDTLYTCTRDDQSVSLYSDVEATRASMYAVSPSDVEEIDGFISAVKSMMSLMGIGENKIGSLVSSPRMIKYYFLSTGELAQRFSHPLLRDFICGVMGNDFGALALICMFAIFCGKNGGIPEGGSMAMAERMKNRFLSLGGQLLTKSEVVRIQTEGNKAKSVLLADGKALKGDYVIVTADPVHVFNKLLGRRMPRQLREQYENPNMMRFSSIHCAFAVDTDKLPFKADHIFAVPAHERKVLGSKYLVLREFTHEASFAPEGKCVIQALVFCNENRAREFIALSKDKSAYEAKKAEFANVCLSLIEGKFPELKSEIRIIDIWTPATYKCYTNCDMGSYMSFIFPPRALPKRIDCKVKGIDNLFLATQWQRSPGGLPIAAECGRYAINEICARERKISKAQSMPREIYAAKVNIKT